MKESKSERPPSGHSEEFERFEALAKALISVPKTVIDARQKEYERQKQRKKRKKTPK